MQPLSGKGLWAALPCRIHSANEPIITGLIFGKNPATKKTYPYDAVQMRCCNTLQHTATSCSTLQHTATHCNTLKGGQKPTNTDARRPVGLDRPVVCGRLLQRAAARCSMMQYVAVCCNVLQCVAARCRTLQFVVVCTLGHPISLYMCVCRCVEHVRI